MRITREQITARVGGQLSPSLSLSVVSVSVRYRSHLRVVRAVFSILVHLLLNSRRNSAIRTEQTTLSLVI